MAEDNDNPKQWSTRRKNFNLFILSAMGVLATISVTMIYPAIVKIQNNLHSSEVLTNAIVNLQTIIVGIFILFLGIAPLFWASCSEFYATRRKIYLISIVLFQVASIVCGIANNIWLLLAMRALQSCGASAVLSVGAGSISDIFESDESGRAYGIFYAVPLLSFLIGTIVGGYLTQYYSWHWIFWSLSIFGGILFFLILFTLPETFHQSSQLSDNVAKQNSLPTLRKHFNPFSPLYLFRHFNVTLTLIYFSLVTAIVYAQDVLVATIFTNLYNLSASEVGFVYFAQGSGYIVGSLVGGHYSDFILKREMKNNGGVSYLEMRLKGIWIVMILFLILYLAYGWILANKLNIALPLIIMLFGGMSCTIIFNLVSTYLIDSFPDQSTSVIAIVNLVRVAFASIMTVSAAPLQDTLGIGYMYTVLVGITALGSGCLALVYSKEKKANKKFSK